VDAEIEIRPLRQADDRRSFSSGNGALDRFFQHYAGQNQFRLRIAVTYVGCIGTRIVGYATVAMAAIERHRLPDRKLRSRMPAYPLPVLRLARLAVDERVRSLGIGGALLRHVMSLALDERERVGCIGIIADAKPDAVSYYERFGFERLPGPVEGVLHGQPTPMFLAAGTVEMALERGGG